MSRARRGTLERPLPPATMHFGGYAVEQNLASNFFSEFVFWTQNYQIAGLDKTRTCKRVELCWYGRAFNYTCPKYCRLQKPIARCVTAWDVLISKSQSDTCRCRWSQGCSSFHRSTIRYLSPVSCSFLKTLAWGLSAECLLIRKTGLALSMSGIKLNTAEGFVESNSDSGQRTSGRALEIRLSPIINPSSVIFLDASWTISLFPLA